jgi:hypothetical protein
MKSKYIRQRIKINHKVTIFVKRKVTLRAASSSSSSSSSSGGGRSAYSSNYFTFYICTTKRGKIWVQFLAAVSASTAVVDMPEDLK